MFLGLEKISDVHTEDGRIRKEISPSTKTSPAKTSLDEKLSNIEKTHQPDTSFVGLSNRTKSDSIPIYIYIYTYCYKPECSQNVWTRYSTQNLRISSQYTTFWNRIFQNELPNINLRMSHRICYDPWLIEI